MNTVETQEERIDRLALYVNLLRQLVIDKEEYSFGEWVMVNHLNSQQLHSIQQVLKKGVLSLINDNEVIPLEEVSANLKEVSKIADCPCNISFIK